jgi:hypothetical protein
VQKCSHKIRSTMNHAAVVEHWVKMRLPKGKVFEAFWLDRSIGLAAWLLSFFLYSFGQLSTSKE